VGSGTLPPGQKRTVKWPVLTYGTPPKIDLESWRFRCFGAVEEEVSFTWKEFQSLPRVRALSDIHCVTRWSRFDNAWEGVAVKEILSRARPKPQARFVMVHAFGGYETNVPLAALLEEGVLLADRHDGAPLPAEHGGPCRLVVPQLYFWKSAKWVQGLELMERNRSGFWERAGYHTDADPWKEERLG
jgi:DMSO/TMAO reductase YedYZ molybdopterin-dependent catalytic subunit